MSFNCHRMPSNLLWLLAQFDKRGALAAFVLRSFAERRDVRMIPEKVSDSAPQDAGAVAVNHANARQAREKCAIEILLKFICSLVNGPPDEVDLHAHVVSIGAGD